MHTIMLSSKEDVLRKYWIEHNEKESDPEMHLYLSMEEMETIELAMDEYAKDVSLVFATYLIAELKKADARDVTIKELFELFKTENNIQ